MTLTCKQFCTLCLEDKEGTVSNGGRRTTNLHFADDINGLAREEEELEKLVECLNKVSTAYDMEVSAEKTKLMTNNTNNITRRSEHRQKLETVTFSQASSIWAQLYLTRVPSLRYSPG